MTRRDWAVDALTLRANPRQWFRVDTASTHNANGNHPLSNYGCRMKALTNGDDTYQLWAMWPGDDNTPDIPPHAPTFGDDLIARDTPPASPRDWTNTLATLQANPGEWFKVDTASGTRSGHALYRRHGCRMKARTNNDGTYTMWAMWPGDAT